MTSCRSRQDRSRADRSTTDRMIGLLLRGLGIALCSAVAAQAPPRVVLVQTANPAPVRAAATAAQRALTEQGLVVDTVEIAPRRLLPIPEGTGPIVAIGAAALHYTVRRSHERPVFYGLVANQQLPRTAPDFDLRGVAVESSVLDQMLVIKQAQPNARRLGVLDSEPDVLVQELHRGAQELGMELVLGADPSELIRADIDMIWLGHATTLEQPPLTRMLLLHGVRSGVPVIAPVPALVVSGAPIGLGMSPEGHGRQIAALVKDHLAGLPVPRLTRPELELHVNDRTMRACGMRLQRVPARVVHHGRPNP